MKKRKIFVGLLILSIVWPVWAVASTFNGIVAFGDSLTDNGNLYQLIGFPPSPPYYDGRFSNGPVWVEHLADELRVPSAGLFDYAYGGAKTGYDNIAGLSVTGLNWQVDNFIKSENYTPQTTLYTLWAGANDFAAGGDPQTAAENVVTALEKLVDNGAQHLLIMNLPDLAVTPAYAGNQQSTDFSSLFNQALYGLLYDAHEAGGGLALNNNLNLYYFDACYFFNDVYNNPGRYGLSSVTDMAMYASGIDPDAYMFWDELHPTGAFHALIGEAAARAVNPIPEPTSLILLGGGILGMLVVKLSNMITVRRNETCRLTKSSGRPDSMMVSSTSLIATGQG